MRIDLSAAHGTNLRYSRGCRCSLCRAARTAYERSRRDGTLVRKQPAQHGTRSLYVRGCRCEDCKSASREYERKRPTRRAENAAYNAAHREERAAYYAAHREEEAAYHVAYYATHRKERAAYNAAYYATHREERAACSAAWDAAHREERAAYHAAWDAANPELRRARKRNRRARVRGNGGTHTVADVLAQLKRQRGRCYWCKAKVGDAYHVDHVTPLALGGSNGPENLVVACARCNLTKNAKHPMDFAGRMF